MFGLNFFHIFVNPTWISVYQMTEAVSWSLSHFRYDHIYKTIYGNLTSMWVGTTLYFLCVNNGAELRKWWAPLFLRITSIFINYLLKQAAYGKNYILANLSYNGIIFPMRIELLISYIYRTFNNVQLLISEHIIYS